MSAKSAPALASGRGKGGSTRSQRPAPPPAVATSNKAPLEGSAEDGDETDPLFASIFGSAERYQIGSGHPSSRGSAGTGSEGPAREDARGVVARASLLSEVASVPVGGAVIAKLSRAMKIGQHLLPADTQVHGGVVGNNDTRVFVEFEFARLPDGTHLSLGGTAQDENGREGIPGKKLITPRTLGSTGLAAFAAMAKQAGRELAGPVGSVAGAGVQGATDSGTDKAARVDRDEYVVIVAKSTAFRIYLKSLGTS